MCSKSFWNGSSTLTLEPRARFLLLPRHPKAPQGAEMVPQDATIKVPDLSKNSFGHQGWPHPFQKPQLFENKDVKKLADTSEPAHIPAHKFSTTKTKQQNRTNHQADQSQQASKPAATCNCQQKRRRQGRSLKILTTTTRCHVWICHNKFLDLNAVQT